MKKFIVFISLLILILSINAYAAVDKVAQTGIKMLDVGAGARACGMGEAFTVIGQDASALFYNPSGIGEIDSRFDLSVGATQWIADIRYLYVAGAYNAGTFGNFGFSVISANYGDDIIGTKVDPESPDGFIRTGNVGVGAYCAGIAYAREFTDKFTIGGQVKYAFQRLGSSEVERIGEGIDTVSVKNDISTMSYDFGLIFYPGFKSFAFGMSVRNFSPRIKYEQYGFETPLTFALGVGLDLMDFLGDYPDYSFNIGAEMLHPRDWQEQFHLGGELGIKNMLFLRLGYKFRYSQEGLNAGVGINYGGIRIDYSYSHFELFDMINRFSVGMAF
jgi:hypothetical protein